MNKNFYFQIIEPHCGLGLKEQLDELEDLFCSLMREESLSLSNLLQSRIYLTDAANQFKTVTASSLYKNYLSAGAVSYIEQPLLSGAKIALRLWFFRNDRIQKSGTTGCMKVVADGITMFFHSVRFSADEVSGLDAEAQTMEAFKRHVKMITPLGMNIEEHCHRTWIYVRDIDRHYSGVVTGRNKIFEQYGLTQKTHYIASTGIGGNSDSKEAIVAMDFLSIKGIKRSDVQYLHALEYLNPTHEYGVAFERGTKLKFPDFSLFFISGTASIDRNGECLYCGDVHSQTCRLFLNIEKLLNNGGAQMKDIQFMIVYLRDIADYRLVDEYIKHCFPSIPFLITLARVCRQEWLIEVECIAVI